MLPLWWKILLFYITEYLKQKLKILLNLKLHIIIYTKQYQLALRVDLLNALKLSFKKPSSTTALKRRLLGFRHVASDRPQGTLLKEEGGSNTGIRNFQIRIRMKVLQIFVTGCFFFSFSTGAPINMSPHVQQNPGKKQTTKMGKVFS